MSVCTSTWNSNHAPSGRPFVKLSICDLYKNLSRGPDSSVGIVTCYRLDGPGIESPWGRDFPHQYRPALGPTHSPIQWVPRLSRGVKRQRRGVGHPPLSSAEVEGRRELYICSPSGTSWPVIGWPLPLPFAKICQYITGLGTVGQK